MDTNKVSNLFKKTNEVQLYKASKPPLHYIIFMLS